MNATKKKKLESAGFKVGGVQEFLNLSDEETALIDLQWMGRSNCIAAWLTRDVLVDCGPATTLDTLLDALGDRQPRALFTHSHPLRPRWSRRRAETGPPRGTFRVEH